MNYNDAEISKLKVRDGVKYLENLYDEQMETKIRELYLHGFNPLDSGQCGFEYKLWMKRKKAEAGPPPEITCTKEYAEKMKAILEREINRAVGKRRLK